MNKRRMMALSLASLLLLAGCGTSGNNQTAPSSGSGGSDSKITIGAALPELQGSFWISMSYGITDEAEKLGVELVSLNAGGYDQIQKQVQQIENLVQKKVDVMLVGATNAPGVKNAVENAIKAGIPVIGISSLPEPKDKLLTAIGADHYTMGVLQAQCLAKEMGGKGEVAIMAGPPGVSWAVERVKGFKDTLAKESPEIKIVAEKATATGRAEGLKLMEDWLQANPNIGGVYSAVDDLGAGAVDALKSANKAGTVKVSSSNLSPIGEEYLRQGFLQCESIQQIVLQGREAVRQAVNHKTGKPVTAFVKTPVLLITKENIDSQDYTDIKAPKDYKPR